jgi:glycine hydroxymethyltransferase
MMGGRGGVILCRQEYGRRIDGAVFPGTQGTSPVSSLAAKAVMFKIAATEEFVKVQRRIIEDADELATALGERGYGIVTGGTDNHQVLVDLSSHGVSGKAAEDALERVGVLTNRNMIPQDAATPGKVSGLRLGTSAPAARGMGRAEMREAAHLIDMAIGGRDDAAVVETVSNEVEALTRRFPAYDIERV